MCYGCAFCAAPSQGSTTSGLFAAQRLAPCSGSPISDSVLEVVDLLLVERQRVHERVRYGIVLRQVVVYDRRERRRVVHVLERVAWVVEVGEIVPLIHSVWRPGDKDEVLPVVVALLDLGEHTRCTRLN